MPDLPEDPAPSETELADMIKPPGSGTLPVDKNLGRSLQELRQFLDRLVHDLREPMRSINTFSELLKVSSEGRLNSQAEYSLGEILNRDFHFSLPASDSI